jgi:DNA-binding response OmpR family regulator
MKCVLVCEDETAIREFIVINLRRQGYEVLEAASGEEALDLFEHHASIITIALLDVMLPGIDGFNVCRSLRQKSHTLGIIMLTARSQENEKIGALKIGADDYITKPFNPSELLARVEALYRRVSVIETNHNQPLRSLVSGCFSIDLRNRLLKKQGVAIELTQVEFQMMQYFFENPEKPLKRSDILSHVWGRDYCGEEKVVDVNIRRLRMKIEDDPSQPRYIQTVWGCGYQWSVSELR